MSVAFDANATADATANGATSITTSNLTVGAGTLRALVVQLCFSLKTVASVTVTWDNGASNQAMTQIVAANGTGVVGRVELWGLVAPVSGAKSLRAAWTGSSDVYINGVSWTGVDQTGGTTTFPHSTSATGSSNTPSVTITSAVGNATMDVTCEDVGTLGSPTKTQTFLDTVATNINGSGSRAAGAASNVHAWTATVTPNWVSAGTDILADAGGGASTWGPLLGLGNNRLVVANL